MTRLLTALAALMPLAFKVPTDAAPGKDTLLFAFGYWNAMSSELQAPVTLGK